MKIRLHRNALKTFKKLDFKTQNKIKKKILYLVSSYDGTGIIPYQELHIKKLEGKWEGYYRMRFGKRRIIFELDSQNWEINIFEIDNRGEIYKKK